MPNTTRHLIATITHDDEHDADGDLTAQGWIEETNLGLATDEQIAASDDDEQGYGFILVDLDRDGLVVVDGSQDLDWARRNGHQVVTAYVEA